MKPIISTTATLNGFGSSRYRWVSGLTTDERAAVKRGEVVLVPVPGELHHTQTPYKVVTHYRGKYGHKNWYGEVTE